MAASPEEALDAVKKKIAAEYEWEGERWNKAWAEASINNLPKGYTLKVLEPLEILEAEWA